MRRLEHGSGGASVDGLATPLEVLLDKSFFVVLVNDRLSKREDGSHDEDEGLEEVGEEESE